MHRMFDPRGASLAIVNAPANAAPEVMPTKIPSLAARSRLHRIASGPVIGSSLWILFGSTSPANLGTKSGVQPCRGWGFHGTCVVPLLLGREPAASSNGDSMG